ncbi:hypothetical protein ABT093_24165 [Kitasatospora sp. NPDC002551]|uniref:hypothetical protein n=1 Tax=Kitasatospora sp. NPDC002551 TaxID=3154539 RepID=UPI00332C698B
MSDTLTPKAAALLADAYTWYSGTLRDLVLELLDDAGLDTGSDAVDDLCGELWLHAAEFTVSRRLSFTELLDLLDSTADVLVTRLHDRPPVRLAGRLATAAAPNAADIAELAASAADAAGYQQVPRPRRPAAEQSRPQRAAA